ncbi:C40 family peptidase [Latilactobacillus curvatus]|uniref:NlpC/P60 domain-containing protein n=1 Tax=Latilactobacillus curvatus TaxID=28038 RepID=A0AAC9Y0W4_LATCU|nr:C40 family peptidase [Latilactobacillus curvatus]ASN60017.1 hypothetical protein CG419_04945 [Latilactobacillus curvatus]MDG2978402.1 C40 family peptidase [Latilactobacillus curvatus]
MKNKRALLIFLLSSLLFLVGVGAAVTPAQATTNQQQAVVNFAKQQLGKPYVWGAAGPNSFDCSGLVQYVFSNAVGISLPRVTTQQENMGTAVSLNDLQPGDLLFWGNKGSSYHDAIYIGDGNFIHAPEPGDVVKITNMKYFYPSFARRVLSSGFPMDPIDESVATVTYEPGYGILAFHLNGESIPGSNYTFLTGTQWKVNSVATINGEEMLNVGNDTYIPRRYTNIDNRELIVNYVPGYGVLTYHSDGTPTGNYLPTGGRYKNNGESVINGMIMYLVGNNEYLPKQYTQFGPGK